MQVDIAPEVDQQAAEDNFIIEAATIVSIWNPFLSGNMILLSLHNLIWSDIPAK